MTVKIDWRIRDAWPKAAVGADSVVPVHGELVVNLPRESGSVLSSMLDRGNYITGLAVFWVLRVVRDRIALPHR